MFIGYSTASTFRRYAYFRLKLESDQRLAKFKAQELELRNKIIAKSNNGITKYETKNGK